MTNEVVKIFYTSFVGFYGSLIYEIFDSAKAFNSQLSKKIFEERPIRINYWNEETGHDIRNKVRNILTVVTGSDVLAFSEYQQLAFLLNEIAINGLIKNTEALEKFKSYIAGKRKL